MTVLLDANVLIALLNHNHEHHEPAARWFAVTDQRVGTCPITQGALIRSAIRVGATAQQAVDLLVEVTSLDRHDFWSDGPSYETISLRGVVGHRQVTDAYLAGLARHHRGRLLTLDGGLAALHPDVAELLVAPERNR